MKTTFYKTLLLGLLLLICRSGFAQFGGGGIGVGGPIGPGGGSLITPADTTVAKPIPPEYHVTYTITTTNYNFLEACDSYDPNVQLFLSTVNALENMSFHILDNLFGKNYTYISESKPSTFKLVGALCAGSTSGGGGDGGRPITDINKSSPNKSSNIDNCPWTCKNPTTTIENHYVKGMAPITQTINQQGCGSVGTLNSYIQCKITIDDPAVIDSIKFFDSKGKEIGYNYSCDTTAYIMVYIGKFYGSTADLQIYERSSNSALTIGSPNIWRTIKTVSGNSQNRIDYSEIKKYVSPGGIINIRTRKATCFGDKYLYSTSLVNFYYLPQVSFPTNSGGVKVDLPVCYGEPTTLKIPYEGNTKYNLTIKPRDGDAVYNYATDTVKNKEVINGVTYFVISNKFPIGIDSLKIEYKNSPITSACHYVTTFTVPEIPEFKIKKEEFINEVTSEGNTYQVTRVGGTGGVGVSISGSYYNEYVPPYGIGGNQLYDRKVNIIENNTTIFSFELERVRSRVIYGGSQYATSGHASGYTVINLSADTHNIYATNSAGCKSNTLSLKLRQPDAISYDIAVTPPKCYDGAGSVTIDSIQGGIGAKKYSINGGAGQSFDGNITMNLPSGKHKIRIYDNPGNSTEKEFKIDSVSALVASTVITAPTFYGENDGSISFNITGGTQPYKYSYYRMGDINYGGYIPTASKFSLSNLTSGVYVVSIKDTNNCEKEAFNVTVPDGRKMRIKSIYTDYPSCSDSEDGFCMIELENFKGALSVEKLSTDKLLSDGSSIDAAKNVGGSGNYVYFTGLVSGTYKCTLIEDYNNKIYRIDTSFIIPEKPPIIITPTVTDAVTKGNPTGKITVGASGGNGGPYYIYMLSEWVQTYDSCTFGNLSGEYWGGREYQIIVSDYYGCSDDTVVSVFEPEYPLTLKASLIKSVSCYGGSDAAVSVSGGGGWGEYSYSRDNKTWRNSNVFSDLSAGTYNFYVKDKLGAIASSSITIANPAPLNITVDSVKNVDCKGGLTGAIYFSLSGGTAPYSYEKLTPAIGKITLQNKQLIWDSLYASVYKFTLKDALGCTLVSNPVTVTEPELLQATISDVVQPTCGYDNGSLTIAATGGTMPYIYNLKSLNDSVILPAKQANGSVVFDSLINKSYQYQLNVTDNNGCNVGNMYVNLNKYINPVIAKTEVSNAICFGESTGSISISALKGSSGIDYFTLTRKSDGDITQSKDSIFYNLFADGYIMQVFDTIGCKSNEMPAAVSQPDSLRIGNITVEDVIYKGARDGIISFKVFGGNSDSVKVYLSSMGEILESAKIKKDEDKEFFVSAGLYTLQATDNKACTFVSDTLRVIEPADSLKIVVTEVKDVLCKSEQTGSIAVEGTGGWGGYTYKLISKLVGDGDFGEWGSFESLYAGTYTVEIKDRRAAIASRSITVYEPADSLRTGIVSIRSVTCRNAGVVNVDLFGGTAPYTIVSNPAYDTVTADTAGVAQFTILENGALRLYITDTNGCESKLETEVAETNFLRMENFSIIPATRGATGVIGANVEGAKGAVTYIWKNLTDSLAVFPNLPLISGIASGHYKLTVIDDSACSVAQSVFLPDEGGLSLKVEELRHETSFKAKNAYVVLSTYFIFKNVWLIAPDNSFTSYSTNDSIIRFDNLHGGHWMVMVTDTLGHNAAAEFDIIPYEEFKFGKIDLVPVSAPDASDGLVSLAVTGGAGNNTFVWTDEQANILSSVDSAYGSILAGLHAGRYNLSVTDKYNNIISTSVEILAPSQALQLDIAKYKNQNCAGMTDAYVMLSATGGWGDYRFAHYLQKQIGNYTYGNSNLYTFLSTGEHYFYVTDKYGRIAELKVVITEPDTLRANVAVVTDVSCKNFVNGEVSFDISGGNNFYYFREKGSNIRKEGNLASSLAAGKHIFEFTDSLGCVCADTLTVVITEPDSLLFKNINITHTFCDEDNGKAVVELKGGTRPYYYEWKAGSDAVIGSDSVIGNLKPSSLCRLFVTDSKGCKQYFEQFIQSSKKPQIKSVSTTDVLCYGNNTGAAAITEVEAGLPFAPYSFTWSNNIAGDTLISGLVAGQYSVMIKDTNNCRTTYYFDITQPDSLYLLITGSKEPHCFEYSDGWVKTETRGGDNCYSYLWSNNATTPDIDSLVAGSYHIRVTDGNGCYFENAITLNEPPYQTVYIGEDVVMCPGNTHVADAGDYKYYRWYTDSADSISGERYLNITEAGDYYLEVKLPDDCSAWGDVSVAIGKSALQADMLMPSDVETGDTIYLFEISNMPVDTVIWFYDSIAFTRLYSDSIYNMPHVLTLLCNMEGFYDIDMQAFSGGCYSPISKEIEIFTGTQDSILFAPWGVKPLIEKISVFPNPASGNFTIEVRLRESAEINLKLFDLTYGSFINERNESGSALYNINYRGNNLHKGLYIVTVTAGSERKQVKIIVQ
ncbi:MAG: T9SS type A sorting domain-containing protein [Bacteroidales bacterium]|jgi:hypothetical protein|nr:T9SS type A sorting domain-containing protein [Bacteroidales bacterium]